MSDAAIIELLGAIVRYGLPLTLAAAIIAAAIHIRRLP